MTERKQAPEDNSLGDAPSQPAKNRPPSKRGVGKEYSRETSDPDNSPTSKTRF